MKTFTLLTTSLIAVTSAHAAMQNETQQMPLTLQVYHAAPSSFDVNSTLVYGQTGVCQTSCRDHYVMHSQP
ncbi:MAG: hypothetical protein ACTJGW_11315, partial [Vibrio casei]|uniref:hypothetical protein n=1 Tax=Vibrio casei TaxID=673372 RepID=UPI0018661410|nr:hypothetical protein [Vibrio casei]